MAKSLLRAVLFLTTMTMLSGCLRTEFAPPPPTASELEAKRARLAKAKEALEAEHRRADATVNVIEDTARREAAADAEITALNRQLLAFEQERAALSVLEREDRASNAQRARVKRLEREIKVLKSLISEASP